MMRPGQSWGAPLAPDDILVDVAGHDGDLAAAAPEAQDAVLVFHPDPTSDFARAVGLAPGRARTGDTVVGCDLMDLGGGRRAVNVVVSGTPPDRLRAWHRLRPVVVEVDGRVVADEPALSVVVANGQFLRGGDLVPRGHPGDGRLEVQVYALRPRERAGMRHRLAGGNHVPHPRIVQAAGRRVTIRWAHGEPGLEVDGRPGAPAGALSIVVLPGAARLLVGGPDPGAPPEIPPGGAHPGRTPSVRSASLCSTWPSASPPRKPRSSARTSPISTARSSPSSTSRRS